MMFTLVSPQKAKSSDGYTVQVADRHSVEYIDDKRDAVISVDFGATIGLYSATLKNKTGAHLQSPIGLDEQANIVSRVKAGLEAMGSKVDVV